MKHWEMNFTEREQMCRVWEKENIRALMSRRAFYLSNEWREEELRDLWVKTPRYMKTASFGKNWGYYVGMEEIRRYYVQLRRARLQESLDRYTADHPDVENVPANLGCGCTNMHVHNTPVIKLAGDGQTAKGIWYSIGQECIYRGNGKAESLWLTDKVCADFVREEGEWKIWHMVVANDLFFIPGKPYDIPTFIPRGTDPDEVEFGNPTIRMITHDNTFNNADAYPPIPEDYYTFSDAISYGPEGHPDYRPKGV